MAYRNFARQDSATTTPRRDIYQDVTDRIIAQLEAGTAPWVCPWSKAGAPLSATMPRNAASGRAYSGVNVLLLWLASSDGGFATNDWLTYKQAADCGANVRKGERGTHIVYADKFIPKGEQARASRDGDDPRAVAFLKSFCVFNRSQVDGLADDGSHVSRPLGEPIGDASRMD